MATRSLFTNSIIQFIRWKRYEEMFQLVSLRPMYCKENNSKKAKIDHHLYLLQEIKAKYSLKLNDQEG